MILGVDRVDVNDMRSRVMRTSRQETVVPGHIYELST